MAQEYVCTAVAGSASGPSARLAGLWQSPRRHRFVIHLQPPFPIAKVPPRCQTRLPPDP